MQQSIRLGRLKEGRQVVKKKNSMKLAVFDLDHTLLPIDTGDGWTVFLIERAGLGAQALEESRRWAREYREGNFSADDMVAFQMSLLTRFPRKQLEAWRDEFIETAVKPWVDPVVLNFLEQWRDRGATLVLATGTHRFVTEPITRLFGIEHLVAATPETDEKGEFTGRVAGSHGYCEGKLRLLREKMTELAEQSGETVGIAAAFSDSINDLPLLSFAAEAGATAYVVHPDEKLRLEALKRGWPVLRLFPDRSSQ